MSLLKWLKKSVVQQPGLTNPLDEVTVDRQNMVASTNEAVMDVMPVATSNSKTRGNYHYITLSKTLEFSIDPYITISKTKTGEFLIDPYITLSSFPRHLHLKWPVALQQSYMC